MKGAGNRMIKGCQKKIIHITNTGSPYFEEAYLVLRRGGDFSHAVEPDEAEKSPPRRRTRYASKK